MERLHSHFVRLISFLRSKGFSLECQCESKYARQYNFGVEKKWIELRLEAALGKFTLSPKYFAAWRRSPFVTHFKVICHWTTESLEPSVEWFLEIYRFDMNSMDSRGLFRIVNLFTISFFFFRIICAGNALYSNCALGRKPKVHPNGLYLQLDCIEWGFFHQMLLQFGTTHGHTFSLLFLSVLIDTRFRWIFNKM